MSTHLHIHHARDTGSGVSPLVELELDWGSNDAWRDDLDRYPGLMIEEVGNDENTEWPIIRVTGPLNILAQWVLVEYCEGSHGAAHGFIARATSRATCLGDQA